MTDLSTIHGIGKATGELLEAAGFLDIKALAGAGATDLVSELERANRILQIAKRTPSSKEVEKWIAEARRRIGLPDEPAEGSDMPVNYEMTQQVMEMLATAPLAIPLPAWQLVKNKLAVSDIPPAILLNRYSGDLEIRLNARDNSLRAALRSQPRSAARQQSSSGYVQRAEVVQPQRFEINAARIRSTADIEAAPPKGSRPQGRTKIGSSHQSERVELIRTPLAETNRGRDPHTRSYVRGVLHTQPISMTVGAIVTLTLAVLLPLAVVASILLLLSDQFPSGFSWVSRWLLVLPCSLPLVGILYLIFGVGGRCRICTQRVFVPRGCRKNTKAHYLQGLGHIIPMCLHMLAFRWFRCTYCGTPVRLKK
ncbi:MAG: DUF4332 domain-containing protein [Verrucomicrobia bacterium]|nr:DUF4332 domain-containing protein [Verrucomicrobiota bacterium]